MSGKFKVSIDRSTLKIVDDLRNPYSYENVPTEVQCGECGAKFPHTSLISYGEFDGLFYRDSDRICPKCFKWDCCELEFEDPEQVATEMGLW